MRLIRAHGVSLDHYWFETTTETSRGQATTVAGDAPESIMAIPDPGSRSLGYDALFGAEVDADMTYLVDSDVDVDDGGGEGASRLQQHDEVYVVIDADRSRVDRGFQTLQCERDTESDL
ncbi:hypothetical protein [Halobacterium salinarum]|uniref:hypothetical protein n=1 Tax=Halobacterium salinarum TaxID=2242 RepID=UPI002557560C|nr:hypothetical protein [Halobacterium salinarum]MDL0133518.1 hypothetical protein [Halobacterium salinarum]